MACGIQVPSRPVYICATISKFLLRPCTSGQYIGYVYFYCIQPLLLSLHTMIAQKVIIKLAWGNKCYDYGK